MDDDKGLFYRLTVLGREADTEYDYVEEDKIFVALAFTWAGDNTILSQYQKIHSEGGSAPALPASWHALPPSRRLYPDQPFQGEPDYDLFVHQRTMDAGFDAGVRASIWAGSAPDAAGASLAVNATNLLDERYVFYLPFGHRLLLEPRPGGDRLDQVPVVTVSRCVAAWSGFIAGRGFPPRSSWFWPG